MCVCACVRACVRMYVYMCVCVWGGGVRGWVRACVRAFSVLHCFLCAKKKRKNNTTRMRLFFRNVISRTMHVTEECINGICNNLINFS